MKKTVLMLNVSETSRDPRVRRVSRSLAANGFEVIALSPTYESSERRSQVDNFEIRRFDGPRRVDVKAMAQLESASPEAAGIVDAILLPLAKGGYSRTERTRREIHRVGQRTLRRARKLTGHTFSMLGRLVSLFGDEDESEYMKLRSMVLTNLEMYRAGQHLRADVIHANDLNSLLAGLMLKRRHGAKLVYDAHEIYPEQFPTHERTEIWHGFFTALEDVLIREADGRMTVCDSLGTYFQNRYATKPFLTVRNVPSIRFQPSESILLRRSSPRVALYHGMFFKNRGLENVVLSARHLRSGRIILRGLGYHEAELRRLASAPEVRDRVTIAPAVPVDELVATASECDIGLNPFPSACLNTEYALPNKHFEYMMAGLAVASSDLVELRRLTQELSNGALFPSIEPEAIAETLEALIARPDELDEQRRRSYDAAKREYHWEMEEQRLLSYYREL